MDAPGAGLNWEVYRFPFPAMEWSFSPLDKI
jgi:hypothetical protein